MRIQAQGLFDQGDYEGAQQKLRQIELDHNVSIASRQYVLNLQIKVLLARGLYIEAQEHLSVLLAKKNLSSEVLQDIAEYSVGLEALVIKQREALVITARAMESIALSMIKIQGGEFTIGSPDEEHGRQSDEAQRSLTINTFKLSRYEVTREEFAAFVNATSYLTDAERGGGCYFWQNKWMQTNGANWKNPTFKQDRDDPVTCVSIHDIRQFISWLNNVSTEDGQYRLPTEAEWEYAARAGSESAFSVGDCLSPMQANYRGAPYRDCGGSNRYVKQTMGVGSYEPNAWGLYDMHGNVLEWTCSLYSREYTGEELKCSTLDDAKQVLRGGSWRDRPVKLRSAQRLGGDTSSASRAYYHHGFRLAKD